MRVRLQVSVVLLLLLDARSLMIIVKCLFFYLLICGNRAYRRRKGALLSLISTGLERQLTVNVRRLLLIALLIHLVIRARYAIGNTRR